VHTACRTANCRPKPQRCTVCLSSKEAGVLAACTRPTILTLTGCILKHCPDGVAPLGTLWHLLACQVAAFNGWGKLP
jgi:hypothetical protein